MSPYLTGQGKWLFVAGVLFSLLGALVREPLLILFGQIPFVVLVVAVATLLLAARSLDRRSSRFRIDDENADAENGVIRLRRREEHRLSVWLENRSDTSLRVHRLEPFCRGEIDVEPIDDGLAVSAGQALCFEVLTRSRRVGRSSLQGFDVLLRDRWGLLEVRDYLPCLQVFETFPSVAHLRRRKARLRRSAGPQANRLVDRRSRSGTDLRELRDFQPGDPLKTIAWKATVRQRRLITREYEDERTHSDYFALDISSSMRAGTPQGKKFDHAIDVVAGLVDASIGDGRQVGLWSFDESVYGTVEVGRGAGHQRRIQRHLVGLKSVVGRGRTALDDEKLREALADYLLVQERLDFRGGAGLHGEVNQELLHRWLRATMSEERRRWSGSVESTGVVNDSVGPVRRFFRLRGIPIDPRSEIRAGAKVAGIEAVMEAMVRAHSGAARLTVITDLCGLSDVEMLERSIRMARRRAAEIDFLVPFTPYYGDGDLNEFQHPRAALVRDLFGRAEQKDRRQVAQRLEAMGLTVRFIGP